MTDWIAGIVQWLHGVGLHLGVDALASAGQAAGQMGDAVGQAAAHLAMPDLLALAAALGWASGIRLYAVVFLVGAMGAAGWIALPPGLHLLAHPAVLAASGFMMLVEFFADKIPWIDSLWDAVHSVIRIPAGALLAGAVFGADSSALGLAAALLGGSLAATSYATKTSTRAAINASPEPFSNWLASFFEDGLVVAMVWLATQHPLVFAVVLTVVLAISALLLVVFWRFLRLVLRKLKVAFGGAAAPEGASD